MTFNRVRSSAPGKGFLARQGNTGTLVWGSFRSAHAVTIGAAQVALAGVPGQLVFANGPSVFNPGEAIV